MKLFEYKPTEYVDVNPDLPLEFMQTQVTNAQNKYDAQNKAINETAANFMKLNPGLFTREEYERIKDKYTTQIENLTGELSKYGDVASIVPQYSKLVSDISFDPSIKALNQDYLAYQEHLKFMAENPNAIDLSAEGPQYSADQPLDLSRYRGVKPEDSIKEIRDVILKDFKPNKDVVTNKWHITDPRDGSVITGSTEQEVTELAAPRIAQAFEDYYPAWVANTTGKAEYDMRRLSNNDLSVYQDEAKGRELYNKLWEPYKQAAYRQVSQQQQQVTGGANAGKAPATTPPPQPPDISPQSTTEQYGYNQLGSIYGDPDNASINSYETMNKHLTNLQDAKNKLFAQANLLNAKGDKIGADASMVKWHALDERFKVDHAWKKAIEAELYGKIEPKAHANAVIKANTFLQKELLGDYGTPEEAKKMFDDMYTNRDNSYMYQTMAAKHTSPVGFSYTFDEQLDAWKKEYDKIYMDSVPGGKEIVEKYKKYLDFSTSGHSYIVGEDTRKEVDVLALSLFNSGKKPKDPLTDKEINSFPEFQKQLFSHKKDDGSYLFDHFSYEVLMDEKDGPVLIVTGIDPSGKNNIVEYDLKDTPNIRALLGKLSPKEAVINSSFIEATQTMKAGNNRKGDFSIGRVGGKTDKHEFTKMPVGDGKFMYKDAEGTLHDNLYALITSKHAAAYMEDSNHVAAAQILSSKVDQAIQSGDPVLIQKATNDYKTYMDLHKNDVSSGKQQPQTQQGQDLGW
jgi:hypothetical protein